MVISFCDFKVNAKRRVSHLFLTRPPDGAPLLDPSTLQVERTIFLRVPHNLQPAQGRFSSTLDMYTLAKASRFSKGWDQELTSVRILLAMTTQPKATCNRTYGWRDLSRNWHQHPENSELESLALIVVAEVLWLWGGAVVWYLWEVGFFGLAQCGGHLLTRSGWLKRIALSFSILLLSFWYLLRQRYQTSD